MLEQKTDAPKIATLQRMNLRDVWVDEAISFTPWIAENIHLIGDILGTQLEVQDQEKRVGAFRSDIVATDTNTGQIVLIENQLERTDHSHLGQIITYASGLRANTIVWIASEFRDEHRAALDWMNEFSVTGMRFFGLEVEVWCIENSSPAVKFSVVCKPNNWKRQLEGEGKRDNAAIIYALLDKDATCGLRELARLANVSPATAKRHRDTYFSNR